MACRNCGKIRSAILHGKMAEAAGLTVDVLREKIGLKPVDEPALATNGSANEDTKSQGQKAK